MVSNVLAGTQRLGRALMLPIAVLPIAGLMLRLGQSDLLGLPVVAAAGDAIFSNLGLLFALGVAVGFARENHGAAGLAGAVGFFIAIKGAEALIAVPPSVVGDLTGPARDLAVAGFKAKLVSKISVPVGLLTGMIAGALYNRYKGINLPQYLAFFGGRRFVPIITGVACLGLALLFGYGWPLAEAGMDALSRTVFAAGKVGLFFYGVLNRLLIVTGLHHIINNIAWFILGEFKGSTGDLTRFFAGDPAAGAYMAGFFPVMMFGLPAACLAMYHAAPRTNRARAGGMLFSMALTSVLTGVTEPVEFSFMFLAPPLYAIHAVLTGLSLVIMDALNVKLGFGFSAGAFDYLLNFNKSTNPLLLLPVGAAYFTVYYGLFRVFIAKFNLATIGRGEEVSAVPSPAAESPGEPAPALARGVAYLNALGSAENVKEVEACATRLRLELLDPTRVDERALKALGARGIVRAGGPGGLQVVLGPEADLVASEIHDAMRGTTRPAVEPEGSRTRARAMLGALGGLTNVLEVGVCATRLRLSIADGTLVDETALRGLGARGVVKPTANSIQVILGPQAEGFADELRAVLAENQPQSNA
jgi:N-acetylglucosamine PTS system EIICBA or EIICB component